MYAKEVIPTILRLSFLLGSIDYYSGSNTFALQFLSMDQLDCDNVKVMNVVMQFASCCKWSLMLYS